MVEHVSVGSGARTRWFSFITSSICDSSMYFFWYASVFSARMSVFGIMLVPRLNVDQTVVFLHVLLEQQPGLHQLDLHVGALRRFSAHVCAGA